MRLVREKRDGSANIIGAALVCAISFLGLYLMILLSVNTYKALDNMNHISSCMRGYLMKMEVSGSLSEGDVQKLVEDLQELGMTGISLYGNFAWGVSHAAVVGNLGPAAYGEEVKLRITGMLEVKSIEKVSAGFLSFSVGRRELEVDISQKGISVR